MELFLSLMPIIAILILLLLFKRTILVSAPITFIITALIAVFYWGMQAAYLFAVTAKGLFVAIDISIIIFGAILFLEFLKRTKLLNTLEAHLGTVSHDKRIQGIILAWFLCSFIEGTAGFGTPAAIVAPLLVGIGFPAITAVSISLIADSTAVAFGAVGTPIRIGLAGIDATGVPFYTALTNFFIGIIIPIIILVVIVKTSDKKYPGAIKEMIPFSLWAGFVLMTPYFLSSFIGQEFPGLIGPLIGLAIILWTTKKGFLVPKNEWHFKEKKVSLPHHKNKFLPYIPYIFLLIFLFAGKYVLKAYPLNILEPVTHNINSYNPGLLFLLAIAASLIFIKFPKKDLKEAAIKSAKILLKPFIAILFLVAFVQIMVFTNINDTGLQSMITIIAQNLQTPYLPFLAPMIGAFGAFVSGSATVSTLMFAQFHAASATQLGMSAAIILALQIVGAGAGNMVSLTNIVAAQATVKMSGNENKILGLTIIPMLIYVILAGLIGTLLILI